MDSTKRRISLILTCIMLSSTFKQYKMDDYKSLKSSFLVQILVDPLKSHTDITIMLDSTVY